MTTKTVVMSLLLAAASPLLVAAGPSAKEEIVPSEQIPDAARQSLQAKAGKHPIHYFTKRTNEYGAVTYDARFHTLTTGDTEVQVTPAGSIVGVYRRLGEPEGSGP
jgi:hypothetical protein